VTAHAFDPYRPGIPAIISLFKTRREVESFRLRVICKWCLKKIAIQVYDMGIGMMSRTYDKIDRYVKIIGSVATIQPKLVEPQITCFKIRPIIKSCV
jgi:hypothetical protein